MKRILVLPSFERSVKKLSLQDRGKISNSLEAFNSYLMTGKATAGFGFKKISHDKYEFRAGIKLRVIVKVDADDYYLVLSGSHDDIKRYLRRNW